MSHHEKGVDVSVSYEALAAFRHISIHCYIYEYTILIIVFMYIFIILFVCFTYNLFVPKRWEEWMMLSRLLELDAEEAIFSSP